MREAIEKIVEEISNEIVDLAKYIHANPELSLEEYKSSQKCIELLEKHGFEVKKNAGGLDTAFKARYKGGLGSKVKVAFLAEYDALNNIGHGCGHNLIAAVAVGSGIALSKIADKIDGDIIVMGTPAEEGGGGGKIVLLDNGEFDDVDYGLMLHPSTENLIGRGGRSTMKFDITFHGKTCHSSAQENGIDALNAMIQLFNGINSVRQLLPINSNIHGYITEGGVATNIVADRASAKFSIRAMTTSDGDLIKDHLERVIKSVELLTMAKAEYKIEHGYAERYPNSVMEEEFKTNYESYDEEVARSPSLGKFGSSDIGNVSLKLPIIHSYFKIADDEINAHSVEFTQASNSNYAYEQTIKAIKSLALTGYRVFTDEEFRYKIDKEFEETVPQN